MSELSFILMSDNYDSFFKAAQNFADATSGDVEAPSGAFSLFRIETPDDREGFIKAIHDENPNEFFEWPQDLGVYVTVLDSDGFIFARLFKEASDADSFYAQREEQYREWLGDDEDDDPIHEGLATDPSPDAEKPTVKLSDIIAKVNVEFAASQQAKTPGAPERQFTRNDYVWLKAWADCRGWPGSHFNHVLMKAVAEQAPVTTISMIPDRADDVTTYRALDITDLENWANREELIKWADRHDTLLPSVAMNAWGIA